MKQLADAGLVTREQRGRWAYYRVVDDALRSVATAITPHGPHPPGWVTYGVAERRALWSADGPG
jgi:DNA-binding transcriptional ArsR family regulator